MCGRYTLTRRDLDEIARELEAEVDPEARPSYRPRYNVAPTDVHPIVCEPRILRPARWGIADPIVINARAESLAEKGLFRAALQHRRCVVPADGFFEWTGEKGRRRPLWFRPAAGGLLRMAGLWEERPEGGIAFTVITTEANEDVAAVHDRMPALLDAEGARRWLERPALDLLCPAARGALVAQPVSARVNDVAHDDPACLDPPDPEPPPRQLKLF